MLARSRLLLVVVAAVVLVGCGSPQGVVTESALARAPEHQIIPAAVSAGGALETVDGVVGDLVGEVVDAVSGDGAPPTTGPPASVAAPDVTAPPARSAPVPPAPVLAAPRATPGGLGAYTGLGTWIDVYDWSRTFGGQGALVAPSDIDTMADLGVQTLYVQTSRWNVAEDILEPERLLPLIERAHQRGMSVVSWYLPTLVDPAEDLRRLVAAGSLDVDAVAVDIESREVTDTAERNRLLVELSRSLRSALPEVSLGAIVFPPVVMEVINTSFWPGFPWEELVSSYDVWIPMAYQSFRTSASGYRDGGRYAAENIDRLRAHVGAGAAVHIVGGIADETTAADVDAMVAAASERGAVGGSLYDWRTTAADLWPHLQAFRR